MLQGWLVVLISLVYVGLLFATAYWGDQRARRSQPKGRPIVYSLTLAIFCTSWGFFGAVGQAASFGWATNPPLGSVLLVVPTYIAPILMFLLGWRFYEKLARIGKRHKITSIADFISARYGKSQALAALVAVIAVVGIIPYIALQLKSVAFTYHILGGGSVGPDVALWQDTALYVALLMAVFAILFGTRHIDASEHHEGMMLAIAFESVVKLVAFLIVGGFITYGMFDGFDDLAARLAAVPAAVPANGGGYVSAFFTQVFLGGLVMFCLPRQFHVAVVENTHPDDVRTARWLYPLYLLAIGFFVWPVAAAGLVYFAPGSVDADTFMLRLPMAADQPALAMLAFIGGFSAGTSMVIVSSLALSIMVCNDVVMPLLLRSKRLALNQRKDLSRLLLTIRRCAITVILLLAYGYYRLTADFVALAAFGVLAFAAASQFAPALIGGMYWKQGSRLGAVIGLSVGFAIWSYTLLLPMLTRAGLFPESLLSEGPLGIAWLRPVALFGLEGLDTATHGTLWSLSVNTVCYIVFSLWSQRRLIERVQAAAFVDLPTGFDGGPQEPSRGSVMVEDLQVLAERFIGAQRAGDALARFGERRGRRLAPGERAEPALIEEVERLMAGVIGASSARVVLDSVLRGRNMQLEEVATIVGEASQVLQFNQELLQATFESVSQGISVVDSELRLVAWNRRYSELFDYPEGMLQVGRRLIELVRYNAARGEYGPVEKPSDVEAYVAQQMDLYRQRRPYSVERTRPDDTVIEVRGNPMPGGGFVTTYSDITTHKRTQEALRESEQSIRIYTDNVPALIAYIDKDLRFRFVNRAYETVWGLKREDIYGRTVAEVLSADHVDHRMPYLEAALAGQPQSFQVELPTPDKAIRHASVTYIPDFGPRGDVIGFFSLFHDVTERVEAERALQDAKATLERRVEERTQELTVANEALSQAKLEAEQANLSKTRFLAAASHDLLQPLNAAGLFCSALLQRLDGGEQQHLASNIESALKSAEGLLSELLDISKLDAGALKPQVSEFELNELLNELGIEFKALAERKGLEFRLRTSRCVVRSDRQLLRRVLQNFLSNAIRYTREGRVLLGCRRVGREVRLEVWDTGPGIPEDQRQNIFQEFHRLEHHDHQGEKCLGLGLAIADRITRMLGHHIGVRSWVGRGSVFSVSVPRGQKRPASAAAPAVPAAGGLSGLRVVCIDNEPAILEGMRALLSGWGCQVTTAGSLEAAMAALDEFDPVDVMLVDYRLENGSNGLEVMDALREWWGRVVPGVLITADYGEGIRESTAIRGYQFMNKPVKPAGLRALLSQVRRRRVTA